MSKNKLIIGLKTVLKSINLFIIHCQIKLFEKKSKNTMSAQNNKQWGFYHDESKTFFYFQTQQEFTQFLELYRRYQIRASPQIEEISKPNFDAFNNVFDELNSSSYETGEQMRQLDF